MSSMMLTATIDRFSAPPSESQSRNLPGKVVALLTFGTATSFQVQRRDETRREKKDASKAAFVQADAGAKRAESVRQKAGFRPPERWGINE
jgi:hypothetical protein